MKTTTWIIFKVSDIKVYQMTDSGCIGKDVIDTYISAVAKKHEVESSRVKISFEDGYVGGVVGSNLMKGLKLTLNKREIMN